MYSEKQAHSYISSSVFILMNIIAVRFFLNRSIPHMGKYLAERPYVSATQTSIRI